jgi:hypothetical protein
MIVCEGLKKHENALYRFGVVISPLSIVEHADLKTLSHVPGFALQYFIIVGKKGSSSCGADP